MKTGGGITLLTKIVTAASLVFVLFMIAVYESIALIVSDSVYDNIERLPYNRVGLLPGTSKFFTDGSKNLFFANRINAAVQLYQHHKIDYILVSGDNSSRYYNEPIEIRRELIARGIPENRIVLDYAGFRTLDSIVRAKAIFEQKKITVISQRFHNERALFLARHHGLEAIAYNAEDVGYPYGIRTHLREYPARLMALFDIILSTEPRFGGETVPIE